jgi:glycerol uptake facilitator-like aquaporin
MGDHLCGVDFNPAVTLGAALRWAVPISGYWRIFLTTLAQFAGSFGAAFLVYAIAGETSKPSSSADIYDVTGHVAFEAVWSTILVYTVCSVMTSISDDPKDDRQLQRRGIAIGFVVAGGLYAGGQNGIPTSSVFNPAIGTALSAVDASLQHSDAHRLWVYWIGPLLGSFFGSGLFSLLHAHNDPVSEDENLSGMYN